ncbi:bis(5'-nucleosyl)-tetraphosphatase (symmetrical) YqeK [Pasteuria penetrans]|uniref:bis(5'-nucleosyl)-tetraphosphatase (symmetrical) YqeK n=1 Tax=Pasteuria penetrans TaxID=86005 RepID=UPI001CAA5AF3|nr:bis(5'-nucleosyl)-tetraphosphatase (symmetrical) YqeK [Pasteuria penetrans]
MKIRENSITNTVQGMVSPQRWRHIQGVHEIAVDMATAYGVDTDDAGLSALLHDACKEWSQKQLASYLGRLEMTWMVYPISIWHGPVAALWAREELGIENAQVLNAVRYHSTGKPQMTMLEKIIYLADRVEPGRDYPGVEELRTLVPDQSELAIKEALYRQISRLVQERKMVHPYTLLAYNEYHGPEEAEETWATGSVGLFS